MPSASKMVDETSICLFPLIKNVLSVRNAHTRQSRFGRALPAGDDAQSAPLAGAPAGDKMRTDLTDRHFAQ